MAGCCTATSKLLNYFVMVVLFLVGALVIVVASLVLASDFRTLVRNWWLWVAVAAGIVIIIVSCLGCGATRKQNRFFLTLFLIVAGIVFALLCVAAIASSIYIGDVNAIARMNFAELNEVSGSEKQSYDFIRESYGDIYDDNECSGGQCQFPAGQVIACSRITCRSSSSLADTLNDWLREGVKNGGITPAAFSTCVSLATGDSSFRGGSSGASAWCGSSTRVLDVVDGWSLGILIGLWVITAFVFLICIGNCVLICGKKNRSQQGVVVAKPVQSTAGQVYYTQPGYGEQTVTKV